MLALLHLTDADVACFLLLIECASPKLLRVTTAINDFTFQWDTLHQSLQHACFPLSVSLNFHSTSGKKKSAVKVLFHFPCTILSICF